MQNINPSNNVNRRGRYFSLLGLFTLLGGLIAMAMGVLFFLLPLLGESLSSPAGICLNVFGIPMTIGGAGLMVRGMTLKKDNMLAYDVGEQMRSFLGHDGRYTYIRNLSRRKLGYIDAVLIGPPGALVLRTVDYSGEWINEKAEWRVKRKGKLTPSSTNPTRECARDVYALRKFLARSRLEKVPVYGVVVFAGDRVKLSGQGSVIPIAETRLLYQILAQNYLKEERIKPALVRATVDALID